MVYGAIDLHMRNSQIRVIDAEGQVLRDQRVVTTAERLVQVLGTYGPMRIVVEASTESEWVAQALEGAGHEVIVADPNFAPMYGEVRRTVKTDVRDAAALAEANRRGWYRAAYRVSSAQRSQRQLLRTRRQLVQMRTGSISLVRSLVRQHGYRVSTGTSAAFATRAAKLTLPPQLTTTIAPLLRVVTTLSTEIGDLDRQLADLAQTDPIVRRLQTVPGVGPVAAVSYRAFVDDVRRFPDAARLSAAIGLVPREASSGERRQRGHITKAGPSELRSVLIQAAWVHWRTCRRSPLRAWADQLAARRGPRIAVVGVARRLSRILYAIWRDETVFNQARIAG